MAKRKVNKSQLVRDYMAEHPSAGPKAVAEALGKQGVKLTPQQVSTIKTNAAKLKQGGQAKPVRASKAAVAPASGAVDLDHLVAAKDFTASVGGVDNAKYLIAALEQLGS